MFNPSDPHRFRKSVAGLCMIGAPLLFLAATIITPGFDTNESAQLALIAESRDAWITATLLAMGGWALFLVATLGVMHMLRERSVVAGHLGGALALLGTLSAIAGTALGVVLWQMAASTNTAAMTSVYAALNDNAAALIPLSILSLGVTAGYILLAWALYRAHVAPVTVAGALGVAAILFTIAVLVASQALYIIASAFLLVGLGMLGYQVLQESVEDWEHPPQVTGFTPATGAR